eukprot:465167-Rhodomonas_salina.3
MLTTVKVYSDNVRARPCVRPAVEEKGSEGLQCAAHCRTGSVLIAVRGVVCSFAEKQSQRKPGQLEQRPQNLIS